MSQEDRLNARQRLWVDAVWRGPRYSVVPPGPSAAVWADCRSLKEAQLELRRCGRLNGPGYRVIQNW